MCGDPSPETFGVSENARRPFAGDFRSVGKRAATPRRGLSECRKMRADPSPGTFRVSENARRPLAGDFRSVGKCAARGRRTFCTFFKVCSVPTHVTSDYKSSVTKGYNCTCMLSFPPKPLVTMSYRVDRVRFFPSLSTLDMNERSLPIFSAS